MLFDQLLVGLTLGATYALIAIGFSLVFSAMGLLNFAHPEFVMLGAMTGYTVTARLHWGLGLALVAGAGVGAVAAVLLDRLALAPIRRQGGPLVNQIIATLGWGTVLTNGAMLLWGPHPLGYPPLFTTATFKVGGVPLSAQHLTILASGVLLMALLQLFFRRTRLGFGMRATADDPEMALLVGIDTRRSSFGTMLLSGGLAGMAGVFVGSLFYASFDLGSFGMRAFAAAVLGGFGDVAGAMVGGLLLGVLENLGAAYVSSAYRDVIAFSIAIAILLIRPNGLLGRGRRTV